MASAARRGLSPEFLHDLQSGILSPLRERVLADTSLCLELRCDYFNIYYRGGSLMKVSRKPDRYAVLFDDNYFMDTTPVSVPENRIGAPADVAAWLTAMPGLKQQMDLFYGKHPKSEREVQQMILRDNNFGSIANDTDYYVCDIEYASEHGRFDVVAVGWPSTTPERKNQYGRRLVLAEVKYGDESLKEPSGLHSHITDLNAQLADASNVAALKFEMVNVFNQKRALGLIPECRRDLLTFSDERPLLLLVLVNHKPAKSRLRELLRNLPPSPHADLRIATGCLLGYGLYDPAILTVDQALIQREACI